MIWRNLFILLPLLACGAAAPGVPEPDAAVVRHVKGAVAALTDEHGRFIAQAACIHRAGVWIAPAAALRHLPEDGTVGLTYEDGGGRTVRAAARIVRRSPRAQFVLVRAEPPLPVPALRLSSPEAMTETMPVMIVGRLAQPPYETRVAVGRIAGIRTVGGAPEELVLDRRCAWAGAVVDMHGALVGFAVEADADTVRPVTLRTADLGEPLVFLWPGTVSATEAGRPVDFRIEAMCFEPVQGKPEVELVLESRPGEQRRFAAAPAGESAYTVRAVPLPARPGAARLRATLVYPGGSMQCAVEEVSITADGRKMSLGRISRIRREDRRVLITFADGTELAAAAVEMPALRADFGGYMLELDAFKALEIAIDGREDLPPHITCIVTVSAGGRMIARHTSRIRVVAEPGAVAARGAATRPVGTMPATVPARPGCREDLEIHVIPAGLAPGFVQGEFNVPRAEVRIACARGHAGDGPRAAARVRIINRGRQTLSALKAQVVWERDAVTVQSDVIDVIAACGRLRPGDVAALYVELPAAAPADASAGRLSVRIVGD